ncbi:tyrosine-protein kinase Src64B-like [Planococcus citri]|uniref:tyrosine-protein kinase Src64B-like n=1 Tax=Planococcus citri TaxID=170843 RepID=UPI0031F8DBAF
MAGSTLYQKEDWFFGKITRKDAEELLMSKDNPQGAFLIRNSENVPNGYALSVKYLHESQGYYYVRHYKIIGVHKKAHYIWPKGPGPTYPTLQSLIAAYKIQGSRPFLAQPCCKRKAQPMDQWEIDRREIKFINKLAQGCFGEVWYGIWRNTKVAVKMLRKDTTMSNNAFLQEAATMKTLKHPGIVALYAVCSIQQPVYIVEEYMNKGSLLEFLRAEGPALLINVVINIAIQVANAMQYLGKRKLIHRDLCARNVVIGDNNVVKICDFGLARFMNNNAYFYCGPPFPIKWTAPEAIIYSHFSIKSDVWSYGIFLMELFTYGEEPYPGMSTQQVLEKIKQGYRMPQPTWLSFPDAVYNLIFKCWNQDLNKRPTFQSLSQSMSDLQHLYYGIKLFIY